MAQQTKSERNRSNGTASTRKSSSSNGSARTRTKPQPSALEEATASPLASRLKTSAIAGGAAAAGLAGGLLLAQRSSRKKVMGVALPSVTGPKATSKNLAEAAKQVGSFGERVGELATEVRMIREGVAHSQKRSPIEVVLEGLTSRRK